MVEQPDDFPGKTPDGFDVTKAVHKSRDEAMHSAFAKPSTSNSDLDSPSQAKSPPILPDIQIEPAKKPTAIRSIEALDEHNRQILGIAYESKRLSLQEALERRNIQFTKDVAFYKQPSGNVDPIPTNLPSLSELEAVSSALGRFPKSQAPVKFSFLSIDPHKTRLAYFDEIDKSISIHPKSRALAFRLQQEARQPYGFEAEGQNPFQLFPADSTSLESLFVHEYIHRVDYLSMESQEQYSARLERYGFVRIPNVAKPQQESWAILDKENNLYKRTEAFIWEKSDKSGNLISGKDKKIVGRDQMREMAKISPSTGYFIDPSEASTEARTALVLGGISRDHLCKNYPDIYKLAKEDDQHMIDRFYGKGVTGQSKFVRNWSGHIVDNNDSVRKAIEAAQLKARIVR